MIRKIATISLLLLLLFSISSANAQISNIREWFKNVSLGLIRPSNTTDTVLIGGTATTSDNTKLEVQGNVYISGNATSSHFAASEICLLGVCKTIWPTGTGGGGGTGVGWIWNGASLLYQTTTTDDVLLGGTVTTTPAKLEVQGNVYIAGNSTTTLNQTVLGTSAFGPSAQPISTSTLRVLNTNTLVDAVSGTSTGLFISSPLLTRATGGYGPQSLYRGIYVQSPSGVASTTYGLYSEGDVYINANATTSRIYLGTTAGLSNVYINNWTDLFTTLGGRNWQATSWGTDLTPTSTSAGIFVKASSTFENTLRVQGGVTTTDTFYAGGYASTTLGFFTQNGGHFGGDLTVDGNATTTGNFNIGSYLDMLGTANPDAPPAGVARFHALTMQGFTRFEQDNEATTNITLGRDNVLIAKNTTLSTITAGTPVYITGSTGNVPNIAPAKADSKTTLPAIGVALDSIGANNFGQVMSLGIISSINTSAFNTGDQVYVSPTTSGALVGYRPISPNIVQRVGSVLVSGVGNGSLLVTVAPFLGGLESGTISDFTMAGNATTTGRLVVGSTNPTNNYGSLWSGAGTSGGAAYFNGGVTTTDSFYSLGFASTTLALNTQGSLHIGGTATFDGLLSGTGWTSSQQNWWNSTTTWAGSQSEFDKYLNATTTLDLTTFVAHSASTTDSLYAGGYASSTGGLFTQGKLWVGRGATTTNLAVSGLNISNCDLKADTNGTFYCGTDADSGGGSAPSWQTLAGAGTAITPTSTNGIVVNAASSTITQLTTNFSTTTNRLVLGTTQPINNYGSLWAGSGGGAAWFNGGVTTTDSFYVGTSTLVVSPNNDMVGINTTVPLETLTVNGNFSVRNADTPTKQYRFRTSGGALDFESAGAAIFQSVWQLAAFGGTQRFYTINAAASHLSQNQGDWKWYEGNTGSPSAAEIFTIYGSSATGVVFNEAGQDRNIRFESDTSDAAFFFDGTAGGKIGLGYSTPTSTLDIFGTFNTSGNATTSSRLVVGSTNPTNNYGNLWVGEKSGLGGAWIVGGVTTTESLYLQGLRASSAGDYAMCINNTTKEVTNAGASICPVSSIRFKENVEELDIGLDELMLFKPSKFNHIGRPGEEIGLIAEDVDLIDRRLVEYEADGVTPRTIKYLQLTALLTKSIQELNVKVDNLSVGSSDDKIKELENRIDELEARLSITWWQRFLIFIGL